MSAVAPVLTSADHTIAAFQVVPKAGADQRLHRAARRRHPGGLAAAGRHHPRRGGPDERRHRHLAEAADALPVYLAVVLGLSLLIMVVVFRSLLVPLVATGGFALSLFAALGGTVAIYQWGWLGGLFGVSDPSRS